METDRLILVVGLVLAGMGFGLAFAALRVIDRCIRRLGDVVEYERDPSGFLARQTLKTPTPPMRKSNTEGPLIREDVA